MKPMSTSKQLFRMIAGMLSLVFCACSAHVPHSTANAVGEAAPSAKAMPQADAAQEIVAQEGDFVAVHYNLRFKTGELIVTSSEALATDAEVTKVDWYTAPEQYGAERIIAGKEATAPHLAKAVIGMKAGEKKTVSVLPEEGYGPVDEKKIQTYTTRKMTPRRARISATEFVQRFQSFPKVDQLVKLTPYYESRIVAINDKSVILEAQVESGTTVPSDFGNTRIEVEGDKIVMTLTPILGASFTLMGQKGIIVDAATDTFKVDFNHPAAGKTLALELEVISVVKQADFANKELAWIEDHDKGLEAAAEKEKPMVLVLYAGWCGWSKRFMEETITDPRIQEHWDDFVWVKIDTDQEKAYHAMYEQEGYPMTVLVGPDGEVISKLSGFKDARALRYELDRCLAASSARG